jgi:SAM-dependent methyltransferase
MSPPRPDKDGTPTVAAAANDHPLGDALRDIEEAMPNFARWLYQIVRSELGRRVVDAGAGIGTYTEMLLEDGREVVALEYDGSFSRELTRRFLGNAAASVYQADLGDSAGLPDFAPGDSMLCLNVLEHVRDDLLALANMRERVNPGGKLVILVPAYPWLFNSMDKAVGHFRRYRQDELESRLAAAGWEVQRMFRFNAAGVPGWYAAGLMRRTHPGRGLSRLYDALVPAFAVVEKHAIRGLWGLSLVAICHRRE